MLETTYEQAQVYLIYLMFTAIPMGLVCRMRMGTRASKVITGLIVFTMCLSMSWLLVLLCNFMYVLNGLFIITLTLMASLMLFMAYRLFTEEGTNRAVSYMFIGYAVAIFVVTLFARLGTSNSTVYVDLVRSLRDALNYPDRMEHLLLNVIMFVPFGALYMMMTPSERQYEQMIDEHYANGGSEDDEPYTAVRYASAAFFLGMGYSAIIESSQLALSMGECDMADVFANTLGTVMGIFVGILGRRFIRYK